jgi:hypothetical protein
MRCESVDFIQTIDDHDKNLCAFMCEELTSGENEKRKCKRQSSGEKRIAWVQRSGHSHQQITET